MTIREDEPMIIGATAADVSTHARRPVTEMSAREMARELVTLREHNDKLGQVLALAAPNVAAIETERDEAQQQLAGLRAELERLRGRLKKRGKAGVRDAGEHWYELVSVFDPNAIKMLPLPEGGHAYLMGVLDDLVIVEVPVATAQKDIAGFRNFLQTQGLKSGAIVVTSDVKFMKLRRSDAKQARMLDAKLTALDLAARADMLVLEGVDK